MHQAMNPQIIKECPMKWTDPHNKSTKMVDTPQRCLHQAMNAEKCWIHPSNENLQMMDERKDECSKISDACKRWMHQMLTHRAVMHQTLVLMKENGPSGSSDVYFTGLSQCTELSCFGQNTVLCLTFSVNSFCAQCGCVTATSRPLDSFH